MSSSNVCKTRQTHNGEQYKLFLAFYNFKWDDDSVYTHSFFGNEFNIDLRLARYHLMKMVRHNLLCQIKYKNRTYYARRQYNADIFRMLYNVKVR